MHQIFDLQISKEQYEAVQIFCTCMIGSISFISAILMLYSWKKIFELKENNDGIPLNKRDYGLKYLSYALFTWTLSSSLGLIIFCLPKYTHFFIYNNRYIFGNLINNVFSTINSLCFIFAATHLQFAPNWVKDLRKIENRRYILYAMCVIAIVFSCILILHYKDDIRMSSTSERKAFNTHIVYIEIPDFIVSISTVAILCYALITTFLQRNLKFFSIFSGFILILILFSQPLMKQFIYGFNGEKYLHLAVYSFFGLFSKISLVIIFSLISLSWAIEQNKLSQLAVDSLSNLHNLSEAKSITHTIEIHNLIGDYIRKIRNSKEMEELKKNNPKFHSWSKKNLDNLDILKKQLCYGIVPPFITEVGLDEIIKSLVENDNLTQNENINFLFTLKQSEGDIIVEDGIKLLIYSIITELITNITKHAMSDSKLLLRKEKIQADISMSFNKNFIEIIVSDDGIGFDQDSSEWQLKCKGLSANKAKFINCGGKFQINSKIGVGTTITLTIANSKQK